MTEQEHSAVEIAVLKNQIKNLVENIARQALEYERRLQDLNHAHAQSAADKTKFVNIDLFHSKLDDLNKWRGEVDQWRSRAIGIAIGAGLVAGITGGTITSMLVRALK